MVEVAPVERRNFRTVRVIRTSNEPVRLRRNEVAFVEIPRPWAAAVASLISLSAEYRDEGLLVTNVGPASRAAAAGIARGDVLLRCDGVSLDSVESLKRLTSRSPQSGGAKELTVEALRGADEMTFQVAAGPLGITVSPLLHRLGPLRRTGLRQTPPAPDDEPPPFDETTLVEVPAELVPKVRFIKRAIEEPANARQRKRAEALLTTAARLA
jgi:hypothetical protein